MLKESKVETLLPKLSPRLRTLLDLVSPNQPVWDIGCDHGHLGYHLYAQGQVPRIHFVDKSPRVMDELQSRFGKFKNSFGESKTQIRFLCRSGQKLEARQISGTVIIAGVGVLTMMQIFEALHRECHPSTRWVVCPHTRRGLFDSAISPYKKEMNVQVLSEILEGTRHFPLAVIERRSESMEVQSAAQIVPAQACDAPGISIPFV